MPVSDFDNMIPPEYATRIIQEATQQSAALRLGTRIPMGTSVMNMPVPKTFPKAAWVSRGGRKPFTDLAMDWESMTAEEVAAIIAIPDVMVEDSSINLWNYARPLLAQAIAQAVDDAILFGVDAPATFPAGGVAAAATHVTDGVDVLDTINRAMSAVESGGLPVTGHAADISVRGALRGVRDESGAFLMGWAEQDRYTIPTLYGLPIAYNQFGQPSPDFFTGDWNYLFIGVRSDIRYDINPAGVIADDDGKVIVSGWQDNTTPMKVWARFACAIVKPVTPRNPAGANPFASADVTTAAVPGGAPGDGGDVGPLTAAARQRTGTTAKPKG
jgi:HK97 family phage major capsid protein